MAITQDGSQRFGIQASPVTINAVTYVAESLSWNFVGNRVDLNDSNGEPLGATVVPGRTEVSGTLQLAANSTATDVDDADIDGDYLIVDCSAAESQSDYTKLSFNGFEKTN